jgi:hypothetical protein
VRATGDGGGGLYGEADAVVCCEKVQPVVPSSKPGLTTGLVEDAEGLTVVVVVVVVVVVAVTVVAMSDVTVTVPVELEAVAVMVFVKSD